MLLLNLVLLAAVAYTGVQLRNRWKAAKARERAGLNIPVKPLPPPKYQPLDAAPPVLPSTYNDVAQKMLFDRSRNPNVVVETPAAPPPPPMPPLPVYHGMMNIGGSGPIAILSLGTGAHQAIHPGEPIGQFKLVDVNSEEIAYEWNGQSVRKKLDELSAAANANSASTPEARTEAPAPAPPPHEALKGPGEDTGRGFKICNMSDGNAEGSVVDGYRKVVYTTPFGQACRWEPIGK
jgi:hypothetical protein